MLLLRVPHPLRRPKELAVCWRFAGLCHKGATGPEQRFSLQDHRLQRASRIGEINQFDSPAFGNGSPHAIQHVIYLLRHTVILVAWRGAAGCC
jgi:hypothetical protein